MHHCVLKVFPTSFVYASKVIGKNTEKDTYKLLQISKLLSVNFFFPIPEKQQRSGVHPSEGLQCLSDGWLRAPLKPDEHHSNIVARGLIAGGFNMQKDAAFFRQSTHRDIFSKSYQINPKSDCIYDFPIDLEPNGSKSIEQW